MDGVVALLAVQHVGFADVGAGTGIWTRMVAAKGVKSARAVEPNDDMRSNGIADSAGTSIVWSAGKAEDTGLPAAARLRLSSATPARALIAAESAAWQAWPRSAAAKIASVPSPISLRTSPPLL